MASQSDTSVSREQLQTALSRVMLERVRNDTYPSSTQLDLLEQALPPSLYREYANVLLEKVADERWPSIWMLRRINRFANSIY